MAQFVQQYAALRWAVVVAFLLTAGIVVGRMVAPVAVPEHVRQHGAPGPLPRGGYAESDAAHLIMCLVMLAMLVFPAEASPIALRSVLTALTVVFAALLLARLAEPRTEEQRSPATDRLVPLGYHTVTAAAMLYAMSGHIPSGHADGPAPVPALVLAGLFAADALLVTVLGAFGRPGADTPGYLGIVLRSGGCVAVLSGPRRRWAMVPHVVMDLGTAYMLIAAVSS
ncbi:DUF5134 domain-containing protein [Nocardia vulneris]|uniref:DUF5134 domain-containing protein n=1 Tax=Nocardia vulneris TaxID=1141657 RepID=A0ABR4Z4H0_9NOCA|nr:DUF5134 domain-containing protein [Nocardia vulneris]KIA60211.1 hypothetical protein FG87_38360 [Nocardia vulneris]